jgi:hypothetical protein
MELTEIGNRFMVRHTETDKIPITESAHVDYLFHRGKRQNRGPATIQGDAGSGFSA